MLTLKKTDLVGFAVIFVVMVWLSFQIGFREYLRPIIERSNKMKLQVARLRGQRQWVRSLKAKVIRLERKVKSLTALLDELQGHLIRDDGDRFRASVARDQAVKALKEFQLIPTESGQAPARLSFRNPVDPNEQLNRLKNAFSKDNPRVVFPRWAVPGSIDVLKYADRFTVEASFADLLRFLGRIQADAIFLEVTDLRVSASRTANASPDRVSATVEVSGLGLPAEEAQEGQN
ncbi:MAG: hypothetical protein HY815_16520 [Candidatus Riflebacteria bacterium]|nr:hypothetical protein [Candidatus Riflebacteria bacterium]